MAEIIPFTCKPEIMVIPSRSIALVLEELVAEEASHPELVSALKKYPPLLGEFLQLTEQGRNALASFYSTKHDSYFGGGTTGDCIREIDNSDSSSEFKKAANIARKYRLAEQLLKMFEHYIAEQTSGSFTRAYIQWQNNGIPFLAMIRNNDFSLGEIVSLVAEVNPEIKFRYQAPEHRMRRQYGNVADLRR